MTRPKLHLDADTSRKALAEGLIRLGHDVTRTPQPGLPADASDDFQLLWATAQGRILFTNNIRDFVSITERYPHHAGILLAAKDRFTLTQLIQRIDCALTTTQAEDWSGQVRWLTDWRKGKEF